MLRFSWLVISIIKTLVKFMLETAVYIEAMLRSSRDFYLNNI